MPINLLALKHFARPSAAPEPTTDAALRSAIVNVANYYLKIAEGKSPAEMEAIIWQHASVDGVDHGQSCAAFASMTLELAAQVVGQHSWVTGGTSYPWPLHKWADARVDPNPASLGIISIRQDAQAHDRWHPLGDGYAPQAGDWVVFDGHVEVITTYSGGVLHTVGGDSLPDFSVNAHEYSDPLQASGVAGFVNNGSVTKTVSAAQPTRDHGSSGSAAQADSGQGVAAIPGVAAAGAESSKPSQKARRPDTSGRANTSHGAAAANRADAPRRGNAAHGADIPGTSVPAAEIASAEMAGPDIPGVEIPAVEIRGAQAPPQKQAPGAAMIPGLPGTADAQPAPPAGRPGGRVSPGNRASARGGGPSLSRAATRRGSAAQPGFSASANDMAAQEAFISEVAPGAVAAQLKYGIPASVTIAQAIEESGWGRSELAVKDHNLFGIKGAGPGGIDPRRTREYENGRWVSRISSFRVYHNLAESMDDHARLLASSAYYKHAMELQRDPDAFAAALTGVYATDPRYGAKLVDIMQRHNLYQFDAVAPTPGTPAAAPQQRPAAPHGHAATPQAGATPGQAPSASPGAAAASPPAAALGGAAIPGLQGTSPVPSASRAAAHANASSPRPNGASPRAKASSPRVNAPSPRGRTSSSRTTGAVPRAAATSSGTGATSPRAGAPSPRAGVAPASRAASPQVAGTQSEAQRWMAQAGPSARAASPRPGRAVSQVRAPARVKSQPRKSAPRRSSVTTRRYQAHMPVPVKNAIVAMAKVPLARSEPLHREVASRVGIRWELLAACDWMQCEARRRYSPVHGEKLGTTNPDGTMFRTKSAALEQCAEDLIELAKTVYDIDLTTAGHLSIWDLANTFAAFRWGGLLKLHHTSAMEFPYSVEGLTAQHVNMRWPNIAEPNAPDKPGGRFHMPFGAVPVVLALNYPATI